MTIPNTTFDRATLISFAGLLGADAFERLDEDQQVGLWMWMHELPYLSYNGLLDETLNALRAGETGTILADAEFSRVELAACHKEARRRHVAAGHSEGCCAATIYTQARKLLGLLNPDFDLGLCTDKCGRIMP